MSDADRDRDEIPLTIELVPSTAWWTNVRSNVSKKDWEKCKSFVRARSGDKCEVCGGRGPKWPVECHEIWDYSLREGIPTQVLIGLIALCPDCHEVKHLGRAIRVGRGPKAVAHLAKVNQWTIEEAEWYAHTAFDHWEHLSEYHWTLDITYLGLLGIEAQPKAGI
jgi:hypothetical protein